MYFFITLQVYIHSVLIFLYHFNFFCSQLAAIVLIGDETILPASRRHIQVARAAVCFFIISSEYDSQKIKKSTVAVRA
jgi:hypothetical protein